MRTEVIESFVKVRKTFVKNMEVSSMEQEAGKQVPTVGRSGNVSSDASINS